MSRFIYLGNQVDFVRVVLACLLHQSHCFVTHSPWQLELVFILLTLLAVNLATWMSQKLGEPLLFEARVSKAVAQIASHNAVAQIPMPVLIVRFVLSSFN